MFYSSHPRCKPDNQVIISITMQQRMLAWAISALGIIGGQRPALAALLNTTLLAPNTAQYHPLGPNTALSQSQASLAVTIAGRQLLKTFTSQATITFASRYQKGVINAER